GPAVSMLHGCERRGFFVRLVILPPRDYTPPPCWQVAALTMQLTDLEEANGIDARSMLAGRTHAPCAAPLERLGRSSLSLPLAGARRRPFLLRHIDLRGRDWPRIPHPAQRPHQSAQGLPGALASLPGRIRRRR